jgi:hypothetical protein
LVQRRTIIHLRLPELGDWRGSGAVSPGREPFAQGAPSSCLVAQPMSLEHALSQRPVWNTDTRLWPTAAVLGALPAESPRFE